MQLRLVRVASPGGVGGQAGQRHRGVLGLTRDRGLSHHKSVPFWKPSTQESLTKPPEDNMRGHIFSMAGPCDTFRQEGSLGLELSQRASWRKQSLRCQISNG